MREVYRTNLPFRYWAIGVLVFSVWVLFSNLGAAALFEPEIARLDLWQLPRSHRDGPTFLNVLRFLDLPQAVALAGESSKVRIYDADAAAWQYPLAVAERLGWPAQQIQVRAIPVTPTE